MNENIFSCMELGKQQYSSIMMMPINRLHEYLKWKSKLEEEKQNAIDEELGKIKT